MRNERNASIYKRTASKANKGKARAPSDRTAFFEEEYEALYRSWWSTAQIGDWYRNLAEAPCWNGYICFLVLLALMSVLAEIKNEYEEVFDLIYNISYGVHVFAIGYRLLSELENTKITFTVVVSFFIDMVSFSHYASLSVAYKLFCYFIRLQRPFKYLLFSNNFKHKGSILGTTLKYCYIFFVLRVLLAWIWLHVERIYTYFPNMGLSDELTEKGLKEEKPDRVFLLAFYVINKLFIPIGASVNPNNELERAACILIMVAGCLVVGGAAVATLSLVVSLYMRPEESFRARYRLIMKDLEDNRLSESVMAKVETFYNMYWEKQRAVSSTDLLPTFPPTLPASVYTDVYFEATQKAQMLQMLSYQMLSEVSKKMLTIHYIPGDTIIQRNSIKSSIIYITYGDIEMLTAEDDTTAMLRMTRGTLLTAASGAVAAAVAPAHVSVRAATFCTAHVLHATDLWRALTRHSVTQDHAGAVLEAFNVFIKKVKKHYAMKGPDDAPYKSSILALNRNLMDLKGLRDETGKLLLADPDIFLEVAGCYIMRNSSYSDESDKICLRSSFPYILQPSSSLIVAWECLVAVLTSIVCVTHPYYLVFVRDVPLEFRFFNYVVTLVFVLDLLVHLSTGTNLEEGGAITFGQTSSQQMKSRMFVLDVLATLPIFEFWQDGHFAGINKILRLPNVFRMLKDLEGMYVYHSNIIRFISYSLMLVFACYLITSLQQSLMCFQSGYCQVTNFTHAPFWDKKPLDQDTAASSLMFGLYWCISTITFTSHKEIWGTDNTSNILYTMAILEVAIVLRIFMEAVYSATIMVTTTLREDYDSLMATVKRFLIRNQIDEELRNRFMTYLKLCWYTDKAFKITQHQTRSIFYDLPPKVHHDIVANKLIKYLLSIPFMRLLKKEELKAVSSASTVFFTSPNEIILNTGDLSNEIYIIKKGICEICSPLTKKAIGYLTSKSHFGSVICLLRIPAFYTVRAITHVQIICISRKSLISALQDNMVSDCADYVKTLPEYTRVMKSHPAFLKYTPPPPSPNRMFFYLPMKHKPDEEFLDPFKRLGFLSILRYVFPRFTIRPDGEYLIRYEVFRMACAVTCAMVFPAYTYLLLQWPWLYYLTVLLDLSAWMDIFQRMLIGYFNEHGILVYHPASTAAHYIKGAFIVDLFGCLPLEHLVSERKESFANRYRLTPTKQFLMMNRLLQLYRFPSGMHLMKDYFQRRDVLMVIQMMPVYITLLNIVVSFMIFCSVNIYYTVGMDNQITEYLIVPLADPGGSWILLFHDTFRFNLTTTPWNLLVASYFWVTYECTTVGYNSLRPSNFELLRLLFVGMVCSAMIMTYFSVRIISIRANVNTALAGFQQDMKDIDVFMKKERLDPDLRKEIHRYYEYNWEKMGGINYRQMLKLCDQITLRTDAIMHIYGHTFNKCPLLAHEDISLLRMIGRAIRSVYFLRDMKIIEKDDVVHNIYFVDYGGVEARFSTGFLDRNTCIRLPRGSVFGNLNDTQASRYPLNIVATSRLHLLVINTAAFYGIIKDFPSVKILLEKYKKDDSQYYILGNIREAVVTLRKEKVVDKQRPRKAFIKTIYFQDGLCQVYLITVSMACIYLDVYNAGFQNNTMPVLYTLYVLDLCFSVKILMQALLPVLVKTKSIKRILLPIRHMYFRREFRYDMLSCVPVEVLGFISEDHRWLIFSWLRLNRMFRIVTVYNCLKRHNERITVNLTTFTAIAGLIWFTLFVHIITAQWYFIGLMIDRAKPNTSWMYDNDGESICYHPYICSMYFIITTFTSNGIGDILPRNRTEVVYVIIVMIVSMLMLMVYVGEFSNIMQHQSFRSFDFFSKYLEMQEYLKYNRVSSNLVKVVNKYTLHLWRETRGQQEPRFLKDAPVSLRLRVMSHIYMHHVTRHHIFEDCELGFMRQLVGCMRLFTYNAGMFVVKESEITNAMYLVHTGKVHESSENKTVSTRIYPAGSYFGIVQGLLRNSPYTHSYQTVIQSQVLTLNLDDWEYLLHHFPLSKRAIYKHMPLVAGGEPPDRWPGAGDGDDGPPDDGPDGNDASGPLRGSGIITTPITSSELLPHTKKSSLKIRRESSNIETLESGKSDVYEAADLQAPPKNDQDKVFEKKHKLSLFNKLKECTRKIIDKLTVTPRTYLENKDELLLEEDEEATVTLLKKYGEATRKSKLTSFNPRNLDVVLNEEEHEGSDAEEKLKNAPGPSIPKSEEDILKSILKSSLDVTKESEIALEKVTDTHEVTQSDLLSELSIALSLRDDVEEEDYTEQNKKEATEYMRSLEEITLQEEASISLDDVKKPVAKESLMDSINLESPSDQKETISSSQPESLLGIKDLEMPNTSQVMGIIENDSVRRYDELKREPESFVGAKDLGEPSTSDKNTKVPTKEEKERTSPSATSQDDKESSPAIPHVTFKKSISSELNQPETYDDAPKSPIDQKHTISSSQPESFLGIKDLETPYTSQDMGILENDSVRRVDELEREPETFVGAKDLGEPSILDKNTKVSTPKKEEKEQDDKESSSTIPHGTSHVTFEESISSELSHPDTSTSPPAEEEKKPEDAPKSPSDQKESISSSQPESLLGIKDLEMSDTSQDMGILESDFVRRYDELEREPKPIVGAKDIGEPSTSDKNTKISTKEEKEPTSPSTVSQDDKESSSAIPHGTPHVSFEKSISSELSQPGTSKAPPAKEEKKPEDASKSP